jgi:hypothetical protein
MSITGLAIERTLRCAVMRSCSVIHVANAARLWVVTTAISAIRKRMTAMNSYPQIRKVIHTLWESPKSTLILATYLTSSVRSTLSTRAPQGASSRRALLSGVLCLAVAIPSPTWADSQSSKDRFKLYLHSRVIKDSQYQCAYKLYMAESKFDSRANLGSHYGIPQLRNKKLKNLDGYTQIDWGIRYVKARYSGNYCLAWDHFKDKGWH